jgi:RecA/RadA recombinase
MANSFLKDLVKVTNNEYASIASDGIVGGNTTFIDTGSYALNGVISGSIYGGIPNKITVLQGEEPVGKSYYCLEVAKNFLEMNENNQVIFFETEGALTNDFLLSRGVDLERFAVLPVATVETFRTQAMQILEAYRKKKDQGKIIMFLDSLGNLSTKKEVEDVTAGNDKRDMTRAQLVKGAFRVLSLELGFLDVPLVCTNHVYDVIGSFFPTKTGAGGSGPKYSASTILNLTKAKLKKSSADTEVVGSIVSCSTVKSRFTKPNTKAKTAINFNTGLDRYYGLIPLAEGAGVFTKEGKKFNTGDGKAVFESKILKTPETYFTKEVLDRINIYVGECFKYGSTDVIPPEDDDVVE